jgi:hypothetical protein
MGHTTVVQQVLGVYKSWVVQWFVGGYTNPMGHELYNPLCNVPVWYGPIIGYGVDPQILQCGPTILPTIPYDADSQYLMMWTHNMLQCGPTGCTGVDPQFIFITYMSIAVT